MSTHDDAKEFAIMANHPYPKSHAQFQIAENCNFWCKACGKGFPVIHTVNNHIGSERHWNNRLHFND